MKGRRKQKRSSLYLKQAFFLFISLTCALFFTKDAVVKIKTRHKIAKQTDQGALELWLDYTTSHPPSLRNRNGIKEMGFITFIYAEMIRRDDIDSLALLQEDLFSFCPGAHSIFEKMRFDKEENIQESFLKRNWLRSGQQNRGLIFIVDWRTVDYIIFSVHYIRNNLKSSIPIEVFFRGTEIKTLPSFQALSTYNYFTSFDLLDSDIFDIEEIGLEDIRLDELPAQEDYEAMKALALLKTSFEEVMFFGDSQYDITSLNRRPDYLFQHPAYQKTGALFLKEPSANKGYEFMQESLEKNHTSIFEPSQSNFKEKMEFPNASVDIFMLNRRKPGVIAVLFFNAWLHVRKSRDELWKELYDGGE